MIWYDVMSLSILTSLKIKEEIIICCERLQKINEPTGAEQLEKNTTDRADYNIDSYSADT